MDDRDRCCWEWIGDGTGIAIVDREHWEQVGRRAGVHDPYRAKAAFVCGAVREFLTAAHLCSDTRAYLGASLLLMPPLEVLGRCVTGDHADGRKGRIRAGVGLLNQLQRRAVAMPLDAEPVRRLRNFLAGGAVAMDSEDPASLDRPTIDQLGRGLALALVALRASAEAGDHGLHAVVLGHISRLHDHRGELHNALDVLRQARRHAERSDNAIVVAWLAAVEARTHATAGNEAASLSAIDRAELVIEPVHAEQVPAWMDYFDRCRLQGFKGFCHLSLKQFGAAGTALDQALLLLDPLKLKERACYLADVATVRAEQGEIEEGCRIISQSLIMLSTTSYATGAERVHGFRARLPRTCRNLPAVRSLDEQLAGMRR